MNMGIFNKLGKLLITGTAVSMLLLGCGGGGGDTASGGPAFIVAGVSAIQTPTLSYAAVVFVETDSTSSIPITNATVTINGVALALAQNNTYFTSNSVMPDGSGNFNLSVTANGATYTATQSAITSSPAFISSAFTSFSASSNNTVTWLPPSGASSGMYYDLKIRQNQSPYANVYSPALVTGFSINVPANTTQANWDYYATITAVRFGSQIANAVSGSNFSSMSTSPLVYFTAM